MQAEPLSSRTACCAAQARCRPGVLDRGWSREPCLDVERVMDDLWSASSRTLQRWTARSTTSAVLVTPSTSPIWRAPRSAPECRSPRVPQPVGSTPTTTTMASRNLSINQCASKPPGKPRQACSLTLLLRARESPTTKPPKIPSSSPRCLVLDFVAPALLSTMHAHRVVTTEAEANREAEAIRYRRSRSGRARASTRTQRRSLRLRLRVSPGLRGVRIANDDALRRDDRSEANPGRRRQFARTPRRSGHEDGSDLRGSRGAHIAGDMRPRHDRSAAAWVRSGTARAR